MAITTEKPSTQQCLIPYIENDTATPAVQRALKALPFRRNIFHLLGHAGGLFPAVMDVYGAIFKKENRSLPLLDWQLIVLRISARLDAEYEWDVNAPVAKFAGMSQTKLDALTKSAEEVQRDPNGIWMRREKAIIRFVDEQLVSYTNSDAAVAELQALLTHAEIVEAFIILSMYLLIARITKGLKIDLDGEIPGLEAAMARAFSSQL